MLIDLQATNDLLDLDTEQLVSHLKANGGLPPGVAEGSIGPLTPSQVIHHCGKLMGSSADWGFWNEHLTRCFKTSGSKVLDAGLALEMTSPFQCALPEVEPPPAKDSTPQRVF